MRLVKAHLTRYINLKIFIILFLFYIEYSGINAVLIKLKNATTRVSVSLLVFYLSTFLNATLSLKFFKVIRIYKLIINKISSLMILLG